MNKTEQTKSMSKQDQILANRVEQLDTREAVQLYIRQVELRLQAAEASALGEKLQRETGNVDINNALATLRGVARMRAIKQEDGIDEPSYHLLIAHEGKLHRFTIEHEIETCKDPYVELDAEMENKIEENDDCDEIDVLSFRKQLLKLLDRMDGANDGVYDTAQTPGDTQSHAEHIDKKRFRRKADDVDNADLALQS